MSQHAPNTDQLPPRSLLFVPAHKPRAIVKAHGLHADLVILDLEDAVPPAEKDSARTAIRTLREAGHDFGARLAIRLNSAENELNAADLDALADAPPAILVLPKVEAPETVLTLCERTGRTVIAMIETARGLIAAPAIAQVSAGLMLGGNDLAVDLQLPPGSEAGLTLARQMLVIAARAGGVAVYDGVFNRLDDPQGFFRSCEAARALGYDGKALIHPDQIEPTNWIFAPTAAEIEEAQALIAAAAEGAERFRDRMIERLHVDAARRLIARAAC